MEYLFVEFKHIHVIVLSCDTFRFMEPWPVFGSDEIVHFNLLHKTDDDSY